MSLPKFAALFLLTLHLLACQNGKNATFQGYAGEATDKIQLNQVGYYPDQRIQFTYADIGGDAGAEDVARIDSFYLTDLSGKAVIRRGRLGAQTDWTDLAGVIARPTETAPLPVGDYRIYISGVGYSYPLHVADRVLHEVFDGSVRGLYYQRASQELTEEYAGSGPAPPATRIPTCATTPRAATRRGAFPVRAAGTTRATSISTS